jgi:putative tryptophan/tyrosine transport system substrate-binding protein
MRRRAFITLLGGVVTAPSILLPRAVHAQQSKIPVIGFLENASPDENPDRMAAFQDGLRETGYVEGRNVLIEKRWADGRYDRLPSLAADLVRRQVSVIATGGAAVAAAKAATTTIPIVFLLSIDPVAAGLVASLSRPGGNLTGVSTLGVDVGPKRLELLHELVPRAASLAVLVNPTNPFVEPLSKDLQAAARGLGLQLDILNASTDSDFDAAFASMARLRVGGLVITPEGIFISRRQQLAALSLRHAVPTIFQYRDFAAAGGLMSYGGDTKEFRLVGVYVGRILNGEKPADLPVQQSTKIELIINLKTAKALGLSVPLALLGRADEVIE